MERVIAPNLVLPDVCSYYLNLHPPAGEDNPYAAPPLFDPFDVSCNVPMNPTEYPPKKPSRPFSPCPFGTSSVPSPVLSLQSHFSNGEDLKSSKQGHTNLLTILYVYLIALNLANRSGKRDSRQGKRRCAEG